MLALVGPDGIVGVHEVGGRAAVAEYAPQMIGLTLEEGKHLLAALQVHLVQAQAEDHSRRRRRCQRCGAQRPLKDQRSRRLVSLFGTVEVPRAALHPVSVRGDLAPGRSTRLARSCLTDARRSTNGPLQRWVRCYPTAGAGAPGGGFSARQATDGGNHAAANPSCWLPGWSKRPSQGRDPDR